MEKFYIITNAKYLNEVTKFKETQAKQITFIKKFLVIMGSQAINTCYAEMV